MKRLVSGIMLTLLLTSMSTLAFNIQPVRASGTIYIRADGSIDPPTAPISTLDNVTYIFTNNIYDGIVVERNNIVVDGRGYTRQGYGSGVGFYLGGIGNVTIEDTNIEGFDRGVFLGLASYNVLSGNNITNNGWGIYLTDSSNNSIIENNIENTDPNSFPYPQIGVHLDTSNNNTVSKNTIDTCNHGIWCDSSNNTAVLDNNITSSIYGWGIGISLWFSFNNTVARNNITNNDFTGVYLAASFNNTLRDNSIANNRYNLGTGDAGPGFINDVDTSNTVNGKPVYYWVSRSNGAVPLDAGYVVLVNCTGIVVQGLNLTHNVQGIVLAYTRNITVKDNNIAENYYGTWCYNSSDNRFFHNNLDNYQLQAVVWNSFCWDDGYPSGGNYWSDYVGIDLYSGLHQNETGSDGIGDTAYVINEDNIDNYPLMKPYAGLYDIGITNVTTSKTVVGQDYNLTITIKILNYGINTETFNLTVYANETVIQTLRNIVLTSRNSTTTTLTWNTTGFAKSNYTIRAYVEPVSGETEISDNTFTYGTIYVSIPGDLNADKTVDIFDAVILSGAAGSSLGDVNWNPNADINSDNIVDLFDAVILAAHAGEQS
jgi:parallel beta-helix repeat protein